MNPMRILHVLSRLAAAGTELNVIRLVNNLDRERFAPSICVLRGFLPETRSLLSEDVPVFDMERREGLDLRLVLKMATLLRRARIDAVHSHNWPTCFHTVLASKLAGVPVVLHGEHGRETASGRVNRSRRIAERLLTLGVDQFTAVSNDIVEHIRQDWGVPGSRVTFIPNGVALDRFIARGGRERVREDIGALPGDRLVGSVGVFRAVKDHVTLVRAFAQVKRIFPEAKLLLVGYDPRSWFRNWLRDEADKLRLASEDVLLPGVRDDIPELLSLLEVYVNSSVYEGMSNTILEAMAAGKPVVATAVGGNPGIVSHGETGWLVPAGDPEAMARRITMLLRDPELALQMGRMGRARVEARHSFSGMIEANAALYEDLYSRASERNRWKRRAKVFAAKVGRVSGVVSVARRVQPSSLTIIAYHRILARRVRFRTHCQGMIVAKESFEDQMEALARRYRVLTLEDVIGHFRDRRAFPKGAVLITFDDGYADNYHCAFPALRRLGLPATFFLTTDSIDSGSLLWWDQVALALRVIRSHPGNLSEIDRRSWTPRLRESMERLARSEDAFIPLVDRIIADLNGLAESERAGLVGDLRRRAEATGTSAPQRLMLTWDEIREMLRSGMTFGGHTVRHAFLDTLEEHEIEHEVRGSLSRIHDETGIPPRAFAYPRGRLNDQVASLLSRTGVEVAVTTERGTNRETADRYRLKRWDAAYLLVNGEFVPSYMELRLAGILPR